MKLIAEIGQNHNGDMGLAKELIFAAKENGADVAKFQVYDAKSLFPPKAVNEWFDYNCKTELSRDQLQLLREVCAKANIEFMVSVFDVERVSWMEELNVSEYKIASRSISDKPLLSALIATKKHLIISLGHWKEKELPNINSSAPISYLYCVSKYPTELTDLHLDKIDFQKTYHGFSDHTLGINASIAAISRGAKIIEKHFTLNKTMYGPDHCCSMTPDELKTIHEFRLEFAKMMS